MKQKRRRLDMRRGDDAVSRLGVVGGFALFGGMMGLLLGAWITVLRIFGGKSPFEELGTTYPAAAATYLACGIVGGALVGLMLPWVRGKWTAALMGWIAAVPCAILMGFAMEGVATVDWGAVAFMSVAFGPILGYRAWRGITGG